MRLSPNYREVPPSIRDHKYAWLFAKEWEQTHNRMEGNSFTFFIGGNGTGKSWASLKKMEILGVDENDEYGRLFDPDHLENHVFFDKQDMLNKIAELEKKTLSERRGYQICLDEAQMSVNAKEWNNSQVLEFSKDMTTIRSSRFEITLNMPTHRMITTDLRQLGIYQVEMFPASKLDLKNGIAHSKLHFLTLRPHEGEIWRMRPKVRQTMVNPLTGLTLSRTTRLNEVQWTKPSYKVRKNYEELKAEFRERTAENKAKAKEEKKVAKVSKFQSVLDAVREDLDAYRDPKKIFSWTAIARETGCGVSTAQRVSKFLKDEELMLA